MWRCYGKSQLWFCPAGGCGPVISSAVPLRMRSRPCSTSTFGIRHWARREHSAWWAPDRTCPRSAWSWWSSTVRSGTLSDRPRATGPSLPSCQTPVCLELVSKWLRLLLPMGYAANLTMVYQGFPLTHKNALSPLSYFGKGGSECSQIS